MFIAVTGNSGTGQSTVASVFANLGARVCSFDETGHRLLDRSNIRSALAIELCRPELANMSGSDIRLELRSFIFRDTESLSVLNKVMHPIMIRWATFSRAFHNNEDGTWILEGALIFELGLGSLFDKVILVSDSLERVKQRSADRDLIISQTAEQRWAAQWPIEKKRELADYVIDNHGTLEELTSKAKKLYIRLNRTTGNGPESP